MTPDRIAQIKRCPGLATWEEIGQLAALATMEQTRRHALFEIHQMATPLVPTWNRGGAMAKVLEVAKKGLEDLPRIT